jgi:peptide/nickel transport system permease protein
MKNYLVGRVLLAGPLLFVVFTVVFSLIHLIPGDPVDFMIGENAALERKAELRTLLHLNEPILINSKGWSRESQHQPIGQRLSTAFTETRYAWFFRDLHAGELRSLHTQEPVFQLLRPKFAHTLGLASTALLVAILIALPLGTLAAWRQYSWLDNTSMVAALVGISMPNFWLGPLLILGFSIELGWFPVSGADHPGSLVLPAITLGLGMSAILTRITRSSVLDTLGEDYIRTARGKGLSERSVLIRHGLRTALTPIITILGLQFGALLAGSIITEEIFAWPGLGREIIEAIRTRDFPVIQGCVLLISLTYVVVNTITDLLYTLVNPRVRLH